MSVAHSDDEDFSSAAPAYDATLHSNLHHVVSFFGLTNAVLLLFVVRASFSVASSNSPTFIFLRNVSVANIIVFLLQRNFLDIEYYFGLYISSTLEGPLCHGLVHLNQTGGVVHYMLAGLLSVHQYFCAHHGSSKFTRFMRKRFSKLCEWIWCLSLLIALPVCWEISLSGSGYCIRVPSSYFYWLLCVDVLTFFLLVFPVIVQIRRLMNHMSFSTAVRNLWRCNRLVVYYTAKTILWVYPSWLFIDYHVQFNKSKKPIPTFVYAVFEGYLLSYGVDFLFFAFFVEEFQMLLPLTFSWLPMTRSARESATSPTSSTSSISDLDEPVADCSTSQSNVQPNNVNTSVCQGQLTLVQI